MLIYEKNDAVAILTISRPEVGNAIDSALEWELTETVAQVVADDDIRVIVIKGAGGDAFSVGQDLQELARGDARPPAESALSHGRPYWQMLAESDRVSIAAIQGKCLGRGLELALACDIRIATTESEFGFPEVSRGTMPSAGGTQILPRTIAKGTAMEMILTSQIIDAAEAYRISLVNELVSPDQLAPATDRVVEMLLSMAPIALKYAKEAIVKGLDLTLEQGLRLEADLSALLQTTEDRKEGIRAFMEKRRPKFVGR